MSKLADGDLLLGRYRVEGFLGAGGMASVYAALDTKTGERVAAKVMLHDFEPALVTRFVEEARALSRVSHPNIVRLVDFGMVEDGAPCMVMELLVGTDLEKHAEQAVDARLPYDQAIPLVVDVLEGLYAIHEVGIVHRDIKPSNIFLEETNGRPRAKLLDFGIAKDPTRGKLTRTGNVVGTPAYLAPEQLLGAAVSARTDLYQVALVLYEALAGCLPYPVDDYSDLYRRVSLPPHTLASRGVPRAELFDDFLKRALSPDPECRPPSALDFIDSLLARNHGRPAPSWERAAPEPRPFPAVRQEAAAPRPELGATSEAPSPFQTGEPSSVASSSVVAVRLPASRLARVDERRWIAALLPAGVRSFRVGAEVLVIVGAPELGSSFIAPVTDALAGRYASYARWTAGELPPGATLSLAQLNGSAPLPTEVDALISRLLLG